MNFKHAIMNMRVPHADIANATLEYIIQNSDSYSENHQITMQFLKII